MAPFLRPFLAVAPTTLADPATGRPYPFSGLYTTVDLPKGAFLGFYNGVFKDGSYGGRDAYVFSLSEVHIRPGRPRGKKSSGAVDPLRHPLAMCNEPPVGTRANVCAVEMTRAKDTLPGLPAKTRISALAFFTCRPVAGGQELFVHYGPQYHRGHYTPPPGSDAVVGEACYVAKPERETPMQMMQHFGLLYVDPECYVVHE